MSSDMASQFSRSFGRGCSFLSLQFLLWGFFPWSSNGQPTQALYVFGDSVADVGNNNYLPPNVVKVNTPPYGIDYPGRVATGRFSNGKVFPDFVAEKLALQTPPPYLSLSSSATDVFLKGVSFASGGAGVLSTTKKDQCVPFDKQIEYFSTVQTALQQKLGNIEARNHLSRSVFLVTVGSNDIGEYIDIRTLVRFRFTLQQFVDSLIVTLKRQLRALYDLGARRVAFVGAASIGCFPVLRMLTLNGGCNPEANDGAQRFNAGVTSILQEMKTAFSDFSYSFTDAYAALTNVIVNPSSYGFTEARFACCGLRIFSLQKPCEPGAPFCPNREAFVFWDFIHPTEGLYRKLVDNIFNGSRPLIYPLNIRQLASLAV